MPTCRALFPMCNQTGDSPAVAEDKKQIAKSENVVLSLGPAIYYD